MKEWPGAPFLGSLHPAGAQNKTNKLLMHVTPYKLLISKLRRYRI